MLTVRKATAPGVHYAPGHDYSVTRCDFADMADLLNGEHVSGRNRKHLERKRDEWASLSSGGGTWGNSFYGNASLNEIQTLMTQGWADGAAKAGSMTPTLSNLVPPPRSIRRRIRWAEAGTDIHIDRALSGDWDKAFRNSYTEQVAGSPRILSLACNFGGHSDLGTEQLFWCAAQMIVTCDLLEQAGYQVELRAVKHNVHHGARNPHTLIDVLVKQAGQPMRADAVAAVFGHAGVYRTYGHTLLMTAPHDIGSGFGAPTAIGAMLKIATDAGLCERADYVFEHGYSMQQAADNITRALTQLVPVAEGAA